MIKYWENNIKIRYYVETYNGNDLRNNLKMYNEFDDNFCNHICDINYDKKFVVAFVKKIYFVPAVKKN